MKGAVLLLALAACSTPYQRRGTMGGYEDQDIGPGAHFITFEGNAYTSEAAVQMGAMRRAKELCPMGFDVLTAQSGSTASGTWVYRNPYNGITTAGTHHKPHATLAVQCRGEAPPQETAR